MGTLFRVLLILALVWIAWRVLRRFLHRETPQSPNQRHIPSMQACAYCGTYVPETELVRIGQKSYCSRAHGAADQRS